MQCMQAGWHRLKDFWHCRLHPAQEESFCSLELRRYPCSNLQVKVLHAPLQDASTLTKCLTAPRMINPLVYFTAASGAAFSGRLHMPYKAFSR